MPHRAKSRNLFGFLSKKTVTYQRSRGEASPSIRAYRAGAQSGDTGGFNSWLAKQPGVRDAGRSTIDRLEKQYRRGVERAGLAERAKEAREARKAGKTQKRVAGQLTREEKDRNDREMRDFQTGLQEEWAYERGAEHKRKGRKIAPVASYTLKAAQKYLGARKASALARLHYMRGYRENPETCAVTRRSHVTDRAKRYRANQPGCKPGGAKKCKLCQRTRDLMVDHIDGNESNGRKANLRWLCRSCNTLRGAEMARTGQGRRTVQYNPGGAKTLGEYVEAVLQHTRGAHDAGGKIIHETPKSRRREFASQIWAARQGRAGAGDYENPQEFLQPGPEVYAVALFDGVGRMGDNVPFEAATMLLAQEKAQNYADETGRDAMLYDGAGISLGRFTAAQRSSPNPVDYRTRLRRLQDKLLALAARRPGYTDDMPITEGGPTLGQLRTMIYPQWEAAIVNTIRQLGGKVNPDNANPDQDLYDRIQEHFRSGGIVVVRTYLKQTNYQPKHAGMFRRPTKPGETGVYVQRGKHWDYVFPQYVHFGRYKTGNPKSDEWITVERVHGYDFDAQENYTIPSGTIVVPTGNASDKSEEFRLPDGRRISVDFFFAKKGIRRPKRGNPANIPTPPGQVDEGITYGTDLGREHALAGKRKRSARSLGIGTQGHIGPKSLKAYKEAYSRSYDATRAMMGAPAGGRVNPSEAFSGRTPDKDGYRAGLVIGERDRREGRNSLEGERQRLLGILSEYWHIPRRQLDQYSAGLNRGYRLGYNRKQARGRINPEQTDPGNADADYQQALKIAELFHGRAVKEEITVTEMIREHDWLWRIGPLVELRIKALTGGTFDIPFSESEETTVHLFCSPDGKQFYLRGGDQELDLDALKMGPRTEWFKDLMLIGEAKEITYQDQKKFHRFKLTDYFHKLGEVTQKKPMLSYNSLAKRLEILGGQYRVETKELVDGMSPGIVN